MSRLFPPPPSHPLRRPSATRSPPGTPSASGPDSIQLERPAVSAPDLSTKEPPPTPEHHDIPHTQSMPGAVEEPEDSGSSSEDEKTVDTTLDEDLSEARLRELYDEEEIDRFLHLFSAYVREVQAPPSPNASRTDLPNTVASGSNDTEEYSNPPQPSGVESPPTELPGFEAALEQGFAVWAATMVAMYLPPPPPPQPSFSARRARLTANRLFLAVEPTYLPIFTNLYQLATWKEPSVSIMYCILYWFLWYNGLLLSAVFLKLLYALIRRKYLSYPTFAELKQYRRDLRLADSFSRKIILRFLSSPAHSVIGMWDTFKDFRTARKRAAAQRKAEDAPSRPPTFASEDVEENVAAPTIVIEDLSEAEKDAKAEEDYIPILDEPHLATHIMHFANRVADIHERIKNIFLWRNPQISTVYGLSFLFLAFATMLPAKVLVRLIGFAGGVFFWHVIPVMAAMSPSDLKRIPPPLSHAPTDAEYAMELISQRVARGLPIEPQRKKRKSRNAKQTPSPNASQASLVRGDAEPLADSDEAESSVPWTQLGSKVAETKAWVGDVKGAFKDGGWKNMSTWSSINPLKPKVELPHGQSEARITTHTFPATRKAPGLITITDTMLYFTPIASFQPDLSINLENILGVKRSSVAKGLTIRWADTDQNGVVDTHEERFLWVGGCDELFARLVGRNTKRWLKV